MNFHLATHKSPPFTRGSPKPKLISPPPGQISKSNVKPGKSAKLSVPKMKGPESERRTRAQLQKLCISNSAPSTPLPTPVRASHPSQNATLHTAENIADHKALVSQGMDNHLWSGRSVGDRLHNHCTPCKHPPNFQYNDPRLVMTRKEPPPNFLSTECRRLLPLSTETKTSSPASKPLVPPNAPSMTLSPPPQQPPGPPCNS